MSNSNIGAHRTISAVAEARHGRRRSPTSLFLVLHDDLSSESIHCSHYRTPHILVQWRQELGTIAVDSPWDCGLFFGRYLGVTPPISTNESSIREKEVTTTLLGELQRQGIFESEEEAKTR